MAGAILAEELKNSITQRVTLTISCRNLKNLDITSKSDPKCEIYLRDGGKASKWMLIGETEIVNNNLNPDFSKQLEINYTFEKEQFLQFQIFDIDRKNNKKDLIGQMETTMSRIMAAKGHTLLN